MWILAGIMAVGAIASTVSANSAEREAADYEKFQNEIDVQRFKSDAALASYNMSRELAGAQSDNIAMAAAMGKQITGSVQNIQDVNAADTARNQARIDEEVARAEKFGRVTNAAIDRMTSANIKSRNIRNTTAGLLSFSKALA